MHSQKKKGKKNGEEGKFPKGPLEKEPEQATAKRLLDLRLLYAVATRDDDGMRAALEEGADINARDPRGWSLLCVLADMPKADTHTAEVLLKLGAKVDLADNEGYTPLMVAILNRNWDLAELFIENGADVNARTTGRGKTETPLTVAERKLFDMGAKAHVAREDMPGDANALIGHLAVENVGLPKVLKMLEKRGAKRPDE